MDTVGHVIARITFIPRNPVPTTSPLLCYADAAERLGIAVLTLYDWLGQSDEGEFQIRGEQVTIEYFQGGRRGQGRIKIFEKEVDSLLNLMRVHPSSKRTRQPPKPKRTLQHITASLGRPDD